MARRRRVPPTDRPWRCWLGRQWLTRTFDSGAQARRYMDAEYGRHGFCLVRQFRTGETWARREGTWTLTRKQWPKRPASA